MTIFNLKQIRLAVACVICTGSMLLNASPLASNGKTSSVITEDAQPAQTAMQAQPALPQSKLQDNAFTITAEQWEATRTGESVMSLAAIRQVVSEWLQDTTNKIEMSYPGGEEGEFWVHELSDWLISLGIPSERLIRSPGSGAADVIRFRISRG
jgi:hypothetical protein